MENTQHINAFNRKLLKLGDRLGICLEETSRDRYATSCDEKKYKIKENAMKMR